MDPYVKFKIGRKESCSKIIHKNLNPVWEEKACLLVDHLREPLYIKVSNLFILQCNLMQKLSFNVFLIMSLCLISFSTRDIFCYTQF